MIEYSEAIAEYSTINGIDTRKKLQIAPIYADFSTGFSTQKALKKHGNSEERVNKGSGS